MKEIISNLKLGFLFLIFLCLFVSYQYIQYPLVCLVICSFLKIKRKEIGISFFKPAVFIVILFFINIISLFYSEDFGTGWKAIETQISLLIIPLIITVDEDFYKISKKRILNIFVAASLFGIIILITRFIYLVNLHYLIEKYGKITFLGIIRWLNISNSQHPTYISLAFLFSIILIVHSFSEKSKYYWIILKLTSILIVLIFIYILNSRAILLSVFAVTFYYVFKFLLRYKRVYIYITLILFLFLFSYLIKSSRFSQNIEQIKSSIDTQNYENIDARFSLWKDALIVWKEKAIFGHGIGDSKHRLLEIHQNRNIEEAFINKHNCHNQFLETATQTGAIGLIALLLVFAIPFYQSIKKKQELLFLFLLICFINFMFESMLQRIAGVVFFAFWYSFLWFVYYKDETAKKT